MSDVDLLLSSIQNNTENDNILQKTIPTDILYVSSKWSEFFNNTGEYISQAINSNKLEEFENNTSELSMFSGYHCTYSDWLMLPNKEWTIEPHIFEVIENTRVVKSYLLTHITLPENDEQRTCIIPSQYCVPAIRCSDDANQIISESNSFVLDLISDLPKELLDFHRIYLHWAEGEIEIKWAKNIANGHKRVEIVKKKADDKNPWFSHAHDTGCTIKQGQLIVMRKYGLSCRTCVSSYTKTNVSINDGLGYFFTTPNIEFYVSWLNSAIYLYSVVNNHQIITVGYYKMQIGDFAHVKFPKYSEFDEPTKTELIAKWQALADVKDLPFLPEQFGAKIIKKRGKPTEIEMCRPLYERVDLDIAWLKALEIDEDKIQPTLDELYAWLREYITTR